METCFIAIGGPSCSGKTTLAQALGHELGQTEIISMDSYYNDLSHLDYESRSRINFDTPNAIDSGLLTTHISALADGKSIELPNYDFSKHIRKTSDKQINIQPFVIVEGIFALYFSSLLSLCDFSFYVDLSDKICKYRRLKRDLRERNRSPSSIDYQYDNQVAPMAKRFVLPTGKRADIILNGLLPAEIQIEQMVTLIKS